jgi:hypothetical protein
MLIVIKIIVFLLRHTQKNYNKQIIEVLANRNINKAAEIGGI